MTAKTEKTLPKIPVTVAGKALELTIDSQKVAQVSNVYNGLLPMMERARNLDVAALGVVVHVGCGHALHKQTAPGFPAQPSAALLETIDDVAASNIFEVATACIAWMNIALHGPSAVED